MIEYFIATSLILLTFGHAVLVKGCIDWSRERKESARDLRNISRLLDEGLDMVAEITTEATQGEIAQTMPDLKQILAESLIQRFVPNVGHASKTQEWAIHEAN